MLLPTYFTDAQKIGLRRTNEKCHEYTMYMKTKSRPEKSIDCVLQKIWTVKYQMENNIEVAKVFIYFMKLAEYQSNQLTEITDTGFFFFFWCETNSSLTLLELFLRLISKLKSEKERESCNC